MAMPLKDTSTDSSIRQSWSAFIKHDIKPSTSEPKRFLPQGSIEVKFQPRSSAPIQHEEGTTLKKSELPTLPQKKSWCQQTSIAQDMKNHHLENSLQDQVKVKSFLSHTPATSFNSDSHHSASQRDTLGRPHCSLSLVMGCTLL